MTRSRLVLALATIVLADAARSQDLSSIDIAYEKFVLDNGLTLIVHEDHSSPQVFVNVYYKVGSRDEEPGKTGFAHLFEHLMFNGSENYDEDYFAPIQDVGGLLNGDTWFDRTRYYQMFPVTALDRVLWLESDRMGHLLGVVTQEKLDNQRGVVQNEKRQGDNGPYGLLPYHVVAGLFPEGHPYSWTTIGSMDDLNAASLEDVHSWFKAYYGAANTIVTVAGDVTAEDVLESVKLYFGDIDAGTPVSRVDDWVPVRTGNTFETMQDTAPNPMLSRNWVAPGRDHEESAALRLATSILGGDETSRLHKALVKEAGIAVQASASANSHDLASMPSITVIGKADTDLDEARAIVDRELQALFENGPTEEELELAKTAIAASQVKRLDSLGSKANTLAEAEFYLGEPSAYKQVFGWLDRATTESVRAAAARWLGEGYHEIQVLPFGGHSKAETGADRSKLPDVTSYPDAKAPTIEDGELDNGIRVRFVSRPGVPAIYMAARFEGSTVNAGDEALAYELMGAMLDKGTESRSAEELQKDLKRAGATLSVWAERDNTTVNLSTLTSKLDDATELLSDVILNPAFATDELEIVKDSARANIRFGKSTPSSLAGRYVDTTVFGTNHPYGRKPATVADVDAVTPEDLRALHETWIRPDQLTILVVGGTDKETVRKALNKKFGKWKANGPAPATIDIPRTAASAQSPAKIILFDAPGAPQSNITAAHQIPAAYGDDHYALALANSIYGGTFLSRINANIREEKGWSYGVFSDVSNGIGAGLFRVWAQVQTDKTAESIVELLQELEDLSGDRPFTAEELEAVRNERVRQLPVRSASSNGVLNYLTFLENFGFADDFLENQKAAYDAETLESLSAAFAGNVSADDLVWFIAGDIAKIEESVRALELGQVEVWDADGNKIR